MSRLTKQSRHAADSSPLSLGKPRAALVVFRSDLAQPRYLLISASSNPGKLTLPGGKVGRGEDVLASAIRESAEEAGVLVRAPRPLGSYQHRKSKGRYHPTQTFVAEYAGQLVEYEPRALHWLTLEEVLTSPLGIRKPIKKQVVAAAQAVQRHARAA